MGQVYVYNWLVDRIRPNLFGWTMAVMSCCPRSFSRKS